MEPINNKKQGNSDERIKKFSKSLRKKEAKKLIKANLSFYFEYDDKPVNTLEPEPDNYSREIYEPHVSNFEQFEYEYAVDFDSRKEGISPFSWVNQSDIDINNIENKIFAFQFMLGQF